MQRAALVVMIPMGMVLLGCGDEDAPAIVDEDTIRWQLSSPSLPFKPHSPSDGKGFGVSCSISGKSVQFKIKAPEIADQGRPSSVIEVRRGSPDSNQCIVSVNESPDLDSTPFSLQDTCKGTDPEGGCTLTGAFGVDGWQFAGTLTCTKLVQQDGDAPISLVNSVVNSGPVQIKLDNCD